MKMTSYFEQNDVACSFEFGRKYLQNFLQNYIVFCSKLYFELYLLLKTTFQPFSTSTKEYFSFAFIVINIVFAVVVKNL